MRELLNADLKPHTLLTTDETLGKVEGFDFDLISESDLKQISALKTPSKVLGVFHMPITKSVGLEDWILVLDAVRDPGNLGTIIRLCDWYNIKHLVCSPNTVDCYNPKVLQATMGSIARVNMVYQEVDNFLKEVDLPVYGAFMKGTSVYSEILPKVGVLIMGNEANGISAKVENLVSQKIAIPQYGPKTTESLNVASATAVLLNEIRRG